MRGASFGLRQSLDTIGAFTGPLLAIALMWLFANNFQAVFWVAVIPAFLSVAVLLLAVKEPAATRTKPPRMPLHYSELRWLGRGYWWVVAVGAIFTLARFSEAFLLLRAMQFNVPHFLLPLVLVVMSLAYSLSSYPAGILSDRMDRKSVLAIGLALLIAADLILAFATNLPMLGLGVVLWGLHMGFSQGLFAALVADTAEPVLRGTAFGVFNLVSGLAQLVASVLALGHAGRLDPMLAG